MRGTFRSWEQGPGGRFPAGPQTIQGTALLEFLLEQGTLTADFETNPPQGNAPLAVQFSDDSLNGPPTGWLWHFGDRTTSTERNPLHVYEDPGTYTVTLEVTDENGTSTVTHEDVVVVATETPLYCDLDDSGLSNAVDVQHVINAALGLISPYDCDRDNNGAINAIDVQLIINCVLGLY